MVHHTHIVHTFILHLQILWWLNARKRRIRSLKIHRCSKFINVHSLKYIYQNVLRIVLD